MLFYLELVPETIPMRTHHIYFSVELSQYPELILLTNANSEFTETEFTLELFVVGVKKSFVIDSFITS